MAIRCANCRAYFTTDEIKRGRPLPHPWPLTPLGTKALQENQQRGNSYACPGCGNHSLEG